MKKILAMTIFLAVGSLCCPGQENVNSPAATEFVRYERIPVSYFNGLPSIEIPVYTVETKDLYLPISLSYHASGIKVNQYPTAVGLGWALNAGGGITRIVNGIPDDTEPDEFVINAYGLSGSIYFYRDQDGNVMSKIKNNNGESFKVEIPVMVHNPEEITFHGGLSGQSLKAYRVYELFYEFTVIKNDGTRLIFGGDPDCIEFYTEKKNQDKKPWPIHENMAISLDAEGDNIT